MKAKVNKLKNQKYERSAAKLLEDDVQISGPIIYIDAFLLKIKERKVETVGL